MSENAASETSGEASGPPQAPARHSWIDVIKTIVSVLSVGAALIGIVWGYVQFQKRQEAGRTQQSFALVEMWEKRELSERFNDLQRALETRYRELPADQLSALEHMDEKTRILAVGNIGLDVIQSANNRLKLESSIAELNYFFTRMEICIETKICSESVSQAFFGDTVTSLWANLNGYVSDKRSEYQPNYGVKLEALAMRFQR